MKGKIFKSRFSDMEVIVNEAGWISIWQGKSEIGLGCPDNSRTDAIIQAIEYVKKQKRKENKLK